MITDLFWPAVVIAATAYLAFAHRMATKEQLWTGIDAASSHDLVLRRWLLSVSFVVSLLLAPAVATFSYIILYETMFWFRTSQWLSFETFRFLWPSDPLTDWSKIIGRTLSVADELWRGQPMNLLLFHIAFAFQFAFVGPRLIFRGLRKLFITLPA